MVAKRMSDGHVQCSNNCRRALTGLNYDNMSDPFPTITIDSPWQYSFLDSGTMGYLNSSDTCDWKYCSALQPNAVDISIEYCLAEPLDRICHIAVSPTALLVVTICVIMKTLTATLATIKLMRQKQIPLVTLGDAMASFIEHPDFTTVGLCTFGQGDVQRILKDRRAPPPVYIKQWELVPKQLAAAAPISVWLTSYSIFMTAVILCGGFNLYKTTSIGLWGSFFESDQNPFVEDSYTFFGGVLVANCPQLFLSLYYLAYNNLLSRLQMAREWILFSKEYQPLRVTDPQGEQYASYRLQLPYKYSISLIVVSISLHWLLSNSVYAFVSTGGYYGTSHFISGTKVDSSLPQNTAVAVGFSTYSFLAMMPILLILFAIPIILGFPKFPPSVVNIGNNSFALSAVCHVSRLSHAVTSQRNSMASNSNKPSSLKKPSPPPTYLPEEEYVEVNASNIEMQQLIMTCQPLSGQRQASVGVFENAKQDNKTDENKYSLLRNLTRSKIRWGVVRMPSEWYAEHEHEGTVEHLSFGVEEDDVQPPVAGRLYV